MKRIDAARLHAQFAVSEAMPALAGIVVLVMTTLAGRLGPMDPLDLPTTLHLTAIVMVLSAFVLALWTDLLSYRIPNGLSRALLAAALIFWVGSILEIDGARERDGVSPLALFVLFPSPGDMLSGLPESWPRGLIADMASSFTIFVFLIGLLNVGVIAGGGDVKLMGAGAIFFGYPMNLEFVYLTILFGGVFGLCFLMPKYTARGLSIFVSDPRLDRLSRSRVMPYALAITPSAFICLAALIGALLA